jgi:hypothetical protein
MSADAEPNADMYAAPDESREMLTGLYRLVWVHSDETMDELELESTGQVPWWPEERREVSLHLVLTHMIAETHRHAGHADIVREAVDGATAFPLMAALEGWPETPWMKPWQPASS